MMIRSFGPKVFILTIILIVGRMSMAFAVGLSGTYYIFPGAAAPNFTTITAAIASLNTNGVAGPVIFNVGVQSSATRYTETITATLSITTLTSTATNTILFQQTPTNTAANPLITSYGGTNTSTSTTQDGIWRILGTDYVTIDGIDLIDRTANTTAATTMEYGYALYRVSATNGCQNDVIKNCNITLNRVNSTLGTAPASNGSTGILSANSTATAATTALAATTAAGSNSNNDFYGNTIQNCNTGIYIIGANTTTAGADAGNDVGGTSLSTGNSILNFGGGATPASVACGVSTLYQQTLNISYNTINNNNGSGVTATNDLRGILIGASTGAVSTINFNVLTIKDAATNANAITAPIENQSGGGGGSNTVSINNNTITGSYAGSVATYYGVIYNNGANPGTLNINNNSITGINAASSLGLYGLYNSGAPTTLNFTGNTITGNTLSIAGGFYAFYNAGTPGTINVTTNTIANNTLTAAGSISFGINNAAAVTTAININNNNLGTASLASVIFNTTANTGANYLISNSAGAAGASISISNNIFYTPTYSVAGSGSFTSIANTASTLSQTISGNVFNNYVVNTTGDVTFISNTVTLPASGVQNVNTNSLAGNFIKTGVGGNVYLYNGGSVTSASSATINHSGNNFSGITVSGATVIQGWAYSDAGSPTNYTAQNNVFDSWTGGTGAVTGINVNITGSVNSITSNQISNINAAGAITGITSSVGNDNIFSNVLNGLTGTSTNAAIGIRIAGGTTQEVYRNKIYDIDNSNAGGTVNGILVSAGTTVNIYNNLIGDLKMPAGSGVDPIRALNITSATATTTINVYYNTIYLNATSSATNFGTTGIYHTTSATATTATLNLRNNIISNNSTAKGTGLTVAYRRSSNALTNYGSTSNNNLFYAGTPSAAQLIFYDGTNSDQTLATYKTRVSTRDAASVTEDLTNKFLSIVSTSASYLHIDNLLTTAVKGAAVNIATYTTDFDGQIRAGNSGYVGSGTAPDIGADEILYTNGWLGTVSTDWTNAANWFGGVPTLDSDVDIPSGKTFYPALTTGTYMTHNINVRSGGSVTLTGGNLQINGGITTGGTFNVSGGGTVELNGDVAQSIPASAFATNTIASLNINNASGVTLGGALNLTEALYPTQGSFNSGGNLTLVSSATQTALIDGAGAGAVTGNVAMQRHLSSGYGYKFLSSPMQAATVASLTSTVSIPKLAADSIDNLFNYTEADTASGFHAYTTTTAALAPMVGYAANFGSATTAKTISITGVVNNGPISVNIKNTNQTFTQGFNLVGNPYPSPIDWNASGWTKTNVDNALYFFDSGTTNRYIGTYSTYIGGVSSDGVANNVIASMQGFFVHVTNGTFPVSGVLGVTNAVRVNNLTAYFHKYNSIGTNANPRALVRVSASYKGDSLSADPIVVYTDNNATKKFNGQLDAIKLLNTSKSVPNLYIRNPDNVKLVINAVNAIDTNTIVPLSLRLPKGGTIDFSLVTAENIQSGLNTHLFDARIGRSISLKNGNAYSLYLPAGNYENRFYITYKDNEDIAPDQDNFYVYRKNGRVYANIRFVNSQPGDLSLVGITGSIISKQKVDGNGIYDLGSPRVLGVYVISFISQGRVHAKKIFVPE